MAQIRHRNIVQCHETLTEAFSFSLILDLADRNLKQALALQAPTPETVLDWSLQIARVRLFPSLFGCSESVLFRFYLFSFSACSHGFLLFSHFVLPSLTTAGVRSTGSRLPASRSTAADHPP